MTDAAKPTKGPWVVFTPDDREDCQTLGVESFDGKAVVWYGEFFDDGIPNDADAYLIAEAGTVYHETGLTPRQLLEQRDELLKAAKRLVAASDAMAKGIGDHMLMLIEFGAADFDLRAIIAKVEAKP